MKKLFLCLSLFIATSSLFAQQGINYKAIISDHGTVLQNQVVQVQFSILYNGTDLEYQEIHSTTTDINGIIILNIGEGSSVSGLYNSIGWHNQLFLKVEIDTGSGYIDFGTTEFKTVPYAIYAENGNGARRLGQLADGRSDILSLYLGNESGSSETSSNLGNTAIGHFSLESNTTGMDNIAVGTSALWNNTVGRQNAALGYSSGFNSLGDRNIFLGYQSGYNETGSDKLYIENSDSATPLIGGDFSIDEVTINGSLAIIDGTEGVNKVLTSDVNGTASWQTLDTGFNTTELNDLSDAKHSDSSLFLGENSGLNDDATDNKNVGIGYQTLYNNISGDNNTANGFQALYSNNTGSNNTANGHASLYFNYSGSYNTTHGYQAMVNNITGSYNTANGHKSLFFNTTGINNIAIGEKAGFRSLGDGNIFLGYNAGHNETGSNKLYIENSDSTTPLIGGDFLIDEIIINGTLNVTENVSANVIGNLTGDVTGNLTGNVTGSVTGNVDGNITAAHSGTADMKAYLFGSVQLNGVTFATSSSDGFTSTQVGTGHYRISSPGLGSYTITATMRYGFIGFITVEKFANAFNVKTYNTSGVAEDRGFDFIVFKR